MSAKSLESGAPRQQDSAAIEGGLEQESRGGGGNPGVGGEQAWHPGMRCSLCRQEYVPAMQLLVDKRPPFATGMRISYVCGCPAASEAAR